MTTKARIKRPILISLAAMFTTLLLCQCAQVSIPSSDSSPRSGASYESQSVSRKLSRPGLGTSWGEGRSSHVTGTEFVRASSSPEGTVTIRYNNAEGAPSQKWSTRQPFSAGSIASIGVKSKGRYLKAYSTGSDPVVIGKSGERYSIYVKNRTDQRIEVVLSVDGLDVQDGKSASHRKRGYVIAPHRTLEVEGFRRSYESVAAFRFGAVDDSYVGRSTGSTRNVGVIGAAVFREKGNNDWHIRKDADPFPGERGSGQFAKPPGSR